MAMLHDTSVVADLEKEPNNNGNEMQKVTTAYGTNLLVIAIRLVGSAVYIPTTWLYSQHICIKSFHLIVS